MLERSSWFLLPLRCLSCSPSFENMSWHESSELPPRSSYLILAWLYCKAFWMSKTPIFLYWPEPFYTLFLPLTELVACLIMAFRVAMRSRASSNLSLFVCSPDWSSSLYASWNSCSIARNLIPYLAPRQLSLVVSSPSSTSLFFSAREQSYSKFASFCIALSSYRFTYVYSAAICSTC